MDKKVTVVGAGNVGATAAQRLCEKALCDVVPLPRYSTVAGIRITELIPKERHDTIVTRTRNGGAEIVSLLKTGSAFYASASSAVEMAESIMKDRKKILACAAYLEGEYGINGLFIGVPVKLGKGGIEEIIQIKLTAEEDAALEKSAVFQKESWSGKTGQVHKW